MFAATYVSATQCTISGEYDQEFPLGRRLTLSQGVDGTCRATVASASYSSGTGLTTITIKESRFTANLVSFTRGPSDPTSMGGHGHTEEDDAGYIPASQLTDEQVESIADMPTLDVGGANKVLGENAAGDDWEMKSVEGTTDEITVNLATAGKITISTALGPVELTSAAAGDLLLRNASKWVNLAKGTVRGDLLRIDSAGNVTWGVIEVVRVLTAGEELSQYNVVYPDYADAGEWKKAQSNVASKARPRGIVIQSGGISNSATGQILHLGFVTNGSWTWTPGATLYLSETAGGITETAPNNAVEIGFALTATTIFFFPAGAGSGGTNSVTGTAGENLAEYDPVYLKTADGKWYKGQTDGTAEETNIWGVVTQSGGIAQDASGSIVLPPAIITNVAWSFTKGADAWLGGSGAIEDAEPETDYRKPLGVFLDTDTLYFFPAPAWKAALIGVEGDILYYHGDEWCSLGIGSEGYVLTVSSGLPAWVSPTA